MSDYYDSDYEDYMPEGYYDDYEDWDDYESDYWHEYIYNHMQHEPKKPTLWQRIKARLKNLYYRWKHPMDDIPF